MNGSPYHDPRDARLAAVEAEPLGLVARPLAAAELLRRVQDKEGQSQRG